MKSIQKPIVIVGAGFAGMTFALNLKNLNPTITIGFCIDFISEILLCVNVLLNYTNNF